MSYNTFVNSLNNGLLILECFTPIQSSLSLSETCKLTGLSKATVFRLLKTLSQQNYLRYDSRNRRYYLGPRVLSLGFAVLQGMEVREISRPYIQKLSEECRKTVNLAVLDGIEMVHIDRIRFPDVRDLNMRIGSRIPAYNTALGRAVLAHQEKEKFQEILKEICKDPKNVKSLGVDGKILAKILDKVRKEGFAISDEEFAKGIRAIAVPLFSPNGVAYAINIVVPSDTVSVDELKIAYASKLIEIGQEISEMLGYQKEK
jgi:IclR family transcriptional regulator, pca regulon regulatory protein